MIYDSLDNIELYKSLSPDIYDGLAFLKNADPDIACGVHQINPRVRAIVSEYETLRENPYGYEAHRRFLENCPEHFTIRHKVFYSWFTLEQGVRDHG